MSLHGPNHKSPIANHQSPRVALKVDCDTLEGTLEGVPRLLDIFAARGIRATFYFTFGPDRSGVAVRRIFTKRGGSRCNRKRRMNSANDRFIDLCRAPSA